MSGNKIFFYLYENRYKCPKCLATVRIPVDTIGQRELFPPNCYNCGTEMEEMPKI